MTEPADVARAFNEWTPDRKDLEIAALRARVAGLEGEVWALRRNADRKCGCMFNHEDGSEDVLHRCAYHGSRDARIAELEAALRAAQRGFADIGNSDRVDEIEDVLSPGWRERWQMDLSRALGDGHG